MSKKSLIIIIVIILVFISIFLVAKLNKEKKEKNKPTIEYAVEKLEYNVDIEKNKKELENELDRIEKEYQQEKKEYNREDIYNILLNSNIGEDYIEIVNIGDINYNAEKYDTNFEKIDKLPEIKYNGNPVELGSKYDLNDGSYYLIRYQKMENSYMAYFICQLKSDGFKDLELYCITTGEYIEEGILIE